MQKIRLEKKFRPEIEGLRFVAALLVAIYHIWFHRVSGGVDVFFVVSGFLITISLVNQINRTNQVSAKKFFGNLLKRLLPVATLVLLIVFVDVLLFYPEIYKLSIYKEIIASLLYFENWQLAFNSVDYLNQSDFKSPVQHYWAMSIQGQFYVLWFVIFWLLNRLFFKHGQRHNLAILLTTLIIVTLCSFIFSVYLTVHNQPWAYFDVRTRAWEFGVGSLLALIIEKIKIPQLIADILSWIGLFSIISLGFLIDVSQLFPGYVALIPILSAIFIIISGNQPSKWGAEKILAHPLLIKLGGVSFSIYLIHWIVLSNFRLFVNTHVNIMSGLTILFSSITLGYLLTEYYEKPLRNLKWGSRFTKYYLSTLVILLSGVSVIMMVHVNYKTKQEISKNGHTIGAQAFLQKGKEVNKSSESLIPNIIQAKTDLAVSYKDKCNIMGEIAENKICYYGDTKNYNYTIALVGGSHSAQWLSALLTFAEEENIRVANITKSDCRFSTDKQRHPSCNQWNQTIIDTIKQIKPNLVFTTVDVSNGKDNVVPQGFINQFEKLNKEKIKIFGVRDNPRLRVNIPECLRSSTTERLDQCSFPRGNFIVSPSPWEKLKNKPLNIDYHDYSNYFCTEEKCLPAAGNIIIYLDREHVTKTYMETIGPLIREDVVTSLKKT